MFLWAFDCYFCYSLFILCAGSLGTVPFYAAPVTLQTGLIQNPENFVMSFQL